MLDMEHPFVQSTNNVDFIKEKGKVGVDEGRHTRTRTRTRTCQVRYGQTISLSSPCALRASSAARTQVLVFRDMMRGGSLKDVLCYRANPLQRCSVKYACQVSHVPGQSTHLDDRGLFMAVGSVATHALSCGEAAGKTTTSSQTRSTNIVCIRVQAALFF